MAKKIVAIGTTRPRVEQGNTVQKDELVRVISRKTNLSQGIIFAVLLELRDSIVEFNRMGRAVKVEGLGTYTPNVGIDGTFDIQYRADPSLNRELNVAGTFTGTIKNTENIGKTVNELVAIWNRTHPEDPVV